jgi:hypothetical protein
MGRTDEVFNLDFSRQELEELIRGLHKLQISRFQFTTVPGNRKLQDKLMDRLRALIIK